MSSLYLGQLGVTPYLTNYANTLLGEDIPKLAPLIDVLAPRVPVIGRTFRYSKWDAKVQSQVVETRRGLGQAARFVAYGEDSTTATLDTHGLGIALDDQEVRAAEGNILGLERKKIATLTRVATRSLLQRVITTTSASLTAATGGAWSGVADAVAEIDTEINAFQKRTNLLPNLCVMGFDAWVKFRSNAKLLSRLQGAMVQAVTPMSITQLGLFAVPNLKVVIADQLYDSAALGLSANLTRLIGSEAWLLYNADTPNEFDASYAKNFYNVNTGLLAVGTPYRDNDRRSVIYPVDWDSLATVTNSGAGSKFTVT